MEILLLAGVALAMALTFAVVLLKVCLVLFSIPVKLAFTVAGGLAKLLVGLAVIALVALVALPVLVLVGVASGVVLLIAALV